MQTKCHSKIFIETSLNIGHWQCFQEIAMKKQNVAKALIFLFENLSNLRRTYLEEDYVELNILINPRFK